MKLYAVWDHQPYGKDSMKGLYATEEQARAAAQRFTDEKWQRAPRMSFSGTYDTTPLRVEPFEFEVPWMGEA